MLRFYQTHVEYDAFDHDRDDVVLAYHELRSFSWEPPGKLKLTEARRDRGSLGTKHRDWRFELEGALPREALILLRRNVSH